MIVVALSVVALLLSIAALSVALTGAYTPESDTPLPPKPTPYGPAPRPPSKPTPPDPHAVMKVSNDICDGPTYEHLDFGDTLSKPPSEGSIGFYRRMIEDAKKSAGEHGSSTERLVHYRCGSCRTWWSIGDGPTDERLWCPWCGSVMKIEPLEPSPPPEPSRDRHEVWK